MDDDDVITCGECGESAVLDDFDVMGAEPGCLFCRNCQTEVEASTGRPISVIAEHSVDISSPEFFAVADKLLRREPT